MGFIRVEVFWTQEYLQINTQIDSSNLRSHIVTEILENSLDLSNKFEAACTLQGSNAFPDIDIGKVCASVYWNVV